MYSILAFTYFHLRVNNVRGNTENYSISNYAEAVNLYKEKVASNLKTWPKIPVALKEINNVFGRCFFLFTEELATVEQKYQGKMLPKE